MSNYPDGAANDKNAPYNQKDDEYWHEYTFGSCDYCEKETMLDKQNCCENCFYDHKESW